MGKNRYFIITAGMACLMSMPVMASPEVSGNEMQIVSAAIDHAQVAHSRLRRLNDVDIPTVSSEHFEKTADIKATESSSLYRQQNAGGELPENMSIFRIKASLHTLNRLKKRGMRLVDYVFSDVNGDGELEIVTLSETEEDHHKTAKYLGIYTFEAELGPVLRYERRQVIDKFASYTQAIAVRTIGFQFCEDWQIASWDVHECHDVAVDSAWNP